MLIQSDTFNIMIMKGPAHNRFKQFEIFLKIKEQMLKDTIIKRMPAIVCQPLKKG